MKVLLNGLQAGNRSGTGQYTANLARWLPGMAPDVEVTVLWPRQVPIPEGVSDPASWFLLRDSRSLLGRVVTDQFGMRGLQDRIDADLVHYPANIAAQFNRPDTIVTIHDLGFMRNPGWFRRDRALYYRADSGPECTPRAPRNRRLPGDGCGPSGKAWRTRRPDRRYPARGGLAIPAC